MAAKQASLFDPPQVDEPEIPEVAPIDEVIVEGSQSGQSYRVSLRNGTCSCSTPDKPCAHMKRAVDVHQEKCKRSRFEFVSAMHKEIRKGDVKSALYWADLIGETNPHYVRFYVRQIGGEETRNNTLIWMMINGEGSYRDLVAAIAQSRKRWEAPSVCGVYKEAMRGWKRTKGARYGMMDPYELVRMTKGFIAREEPKYLFDMLWAFLEREEPAPEDAVAQFRETLIEEVRRKKIALDRPETMIELHELKTKRDASEIEWMLVEALNGAWTEEMNDFVHSPTIEVEPHDGSYIKRVPNYAYDSHTVLGKSWLEKYGTKLRPGRPSPGPLDLRWSGQLIGVSWRYAAWAQFGFDYAKLPWEQVRMTDEFWNLALDFAGDRRWIGERR